MAKSLPSQIDMKDLKPLLEALDSIFNTSGNRQLAANLFGNFSQKEDMPIQDYAISLEHLFRRAYPHESIDTNPFIIDKFIAGIISPEVRVKLRTPPQPATYRDAVNAAMAFSAAIYPDHQVQRQRSTAYKMAATSSHPLQTRQAKDRHIQAIDTPQEEAVLAMGKNTCSVHKTDKHSNAECRLQKEQAAQAPKKPTRRPSARPKTLKFKSNRAKKRFLRSIEEAEDVEWESVSDSEAETSEDVQVTEQSLLALKLCDDSEDVEPHILMIQPHDNKDTADESLLDEAERVFAAGAANNPTIASMGDPIEELASVVNANIIQTDVQMSEPEGERIKCEPDIHTPPWAEREETVETQPLTVNPPVTGMLETPPPSEFVANSEALTPVFDERPSGPTPSTSAAADNADASAILVQEVLNNPDVLKSVLSQIPGIAQFPLLGTSDVTQTSFTNSVVPAAKPLPEPTETPLNPKGPMVIGGVIVKRKTKTYTEAISPATSMPPPPPPPKESGIDKAAKLIRDLPNGAQLVRNVAAPVAPAAPATPMPISSADLTSALRNYRPPQATQDRSRSSSRARKTKTPRRISPESSKPVATPTKTVSFGRGRGRGRQVTFQPTTAVGISNRPRSPRPSPQGHQPLPRGIDIPEIRLNERTTVTLSDKTGPAPPARNLPAPEELSHLAKAMLTPPDFRGELVTPLELAQVTYTPSDKDEGSDVDLRTGKALSLSERFPEYAGTLNIAYKPDAGYKEHLNFGATVSHKEPEIWDRVAIFRDPTSFYNSFFKDYNFKMEIRRKGKQHVMASNLLLTRQPPSKNPDVPTPSSQQNRRQLEEKLRVAFSCVFDVMDEAYRYEDPALIRSLRDNVFIPGIESICHMFCSSRCRSCYKGFDDRSRGDRRAFFQARLDYMSQIPEVEFKVAEERQSTVLLQKTKVVENGPPTDIFNLGLSRKAQDAIAAFTRKEKEAFDEDLRYFAEIHQTTKMGARAYPFKDIPPSLNSNLDSKALEFINTHRRINLAPVAERLVQRYVFRHQTLISKFGSRDQRAK